MTSIGHLVAKFQVQEGGGTATTKIPNHSGATASAAVEDDDTTKLPKAPAANAPGSVVARQKSKPPPPGRKPTQVPPCSVNMRRQDSETPQNQERRAAGSSARQSSISFTTEDLDLFQKKKQVSQKKRTASAIPKRKGRPQYSEPPTQAEKSDIRRSRKSNTQQEANSEKRRSRSVGAPAFGGLRPAPPGSKPQVASKPPVANKPTEVRKKPSGLPRPFQVQRAPDTSDDQCEQRSVSSSRNKSYKVAVRAPSAVKSSLSSKPPPAEKPRPFSGSRQVYQRPPHEHNGESDEILTDTKQECDISVEQATKSDDSKVDIDSKSKPLRSQLAGSFIPVPKSSAKVPPKTSPKPKSPALSPLHSPLPQRALGHVSATNERVKEVAKANIIGVLAKRSGIPVSKPASNSLSAAEKQSETLNNSEERVSIVVEGVTTTCTSDSFRSTTTEQRERISVNIAGVTTLCTSDSVKVKNEEPADSEETSHKDDTESSEKTTEDIERLSESNKAGDQQIKTSAQSISGKKAVVSPLGSPVTTKKSPVKPSVPPPPPPTTKDTNQDSDSNGSVKNYEEAAKKDNPLIPPKPSVKPSKFSPNNKKQQKQTGELTTKKPPQLFLADEKGFPSDSNDADDEEDVVANTAASPKSRVYIKSFSVEQKDLVSSSDSLNIARPSSALSPESDSSSGEQHREKNKKGLLGKIRKITLDTLPSDDITDEKRQVGKATFYQEGNVPGTTTEGELHRTVGKTTFYSADNNKANAGDLSSQDEKLTEHQENPDLQKHRKVALRNSAAGRKLSNKSFRSGIFVENELYETGGVYENMVFGPIVKNENKNGHASQQNMEGLDEGNENKMAPVSKNMISQTNPSDDINSTDDDQRVPSMHIYDNAIPIINNNHTYMNVEFTGYNSYVSSNRSVWRRRTIKRRMPIKTPDDDNETEEGAQTEDFEEFSNSDDSFDSDTCYTDESDEEKNKTEPIYTTVQGEAPPKEESPTKVAKLKRIATELLTTEKAYVKRLHLIDQIFHFKIVIENRVHHMFPDDVIPQMFSNIKSIYQFHNDFLLPQLEKRMAEWDTIPRIGDLMSKFAPFLKLYTEYVRNFDHATSTVNTWIQRSPMFASIMAELQKKPECGMLSLQHHMLEPIQRVPRYELLLKDYLKHLPEDSQDKAATEKALELVTTAAAHSNETMWKIEKFRKLLELNEMFGGVVDLIDPSRELLKEGKIFKISARNGALYERYLFLFTDMLIVCTNKMGLTRSYHINNILKLSGMQVLEGDNLETPHTFYVKTKSKTIELHNSTHQDMQDWFTSIENVVADFTKRQMSRLAGLKPAETDEKIGLYAPTWVKDQNTSMCMLCGSAFSMLKRRHHCRGCGIVVCARCSSHKAPLAYQNNKADRVCDNCYKTLSGRHEAEKLISSTNANSHVKGVLQVKGSDPAVVAGMMFLSSDRKFWERRWFTLHENFVLYTFKAPQDVHAITSMPLPGYTVKEASKEDHIEREQVIKIHHPGTKKAYYFHVDQAANYTKWLTAIQCAVKLELPADYVPLSKR